MKQIFITLVIVAAIALVTVIWSVGVSNSERVLRNKLDAQVGIEQFYISGPTK